MRSATAFAVFSATALFACIDSSMDVFTLGEAAQIFYQSRIIIAQVAACLAVLFTAYVVASGRRHERGVYTPAAGDTCAEEVWNSSLVSTEDIGEPATSTGSVDPSVLLKDSPHGTRSVHAPADADLLELFDDFDSAISAELQHQLSTVMGSLGTEHMQRLNEATFDGRDLLQDAVNAFDVSYRDDKQNNLRQTSPAPSGVSIEEALNRLEQEVQRRSGRICQAPRTSIFSPLMVAFIVGVLGLCGACADHLQASEICSSTLMEAGIVSVFMPMGYVVCSRIRSASSLPTR
jgi:hypothetical protein